MPGDNVELVIELHYTGRDGKGSAVCHPRRRTHRRRRNDPEIVK